VLDATAAAVPVLPVHFGAIVSSVDAVAEELLAAHEEEFRAALDKLDGYAQYVVKGRYVERALLNEVLSESEDAAQPKDAIRDKPSDATRNERLALGELVNNFVEAKRQADTRRVLQLLDNLGLRLAPQQPSHELDAVHVACLAEVKHQDELEQELGKLSEEWDGRVELRLLGPLAPYDFVTTQAPQG
jgi:Gas vesicle synthesis protein GvpL/GvpF